MSRNINTVASIAAMLIGSSVALAHESALEGSIDMVEGAGYITTDNGVLRTGGGECLRIGGFSEENQINACEGIEGDAAANADADANADANAAAAPEPEPVKKEPIVSTATLGGEALFEFDSDVMTATGEERLATLIAQLDKFQEISAIDVAGHTDSTGPEEYNQGLSERRANTVKSFLEAAYPNAAITATGMGESSPAATNSTKEGRSENRRVEVQVTAKSITE
ncbi:MAG: OmpA family protein [Granulosicoccus sp.]